MFILAGFLFSSLKHWRLQQAYHIEHDIDNDHDCHELVISDIIGNTRKHNFAIAKQKQIRKNKTNNICYTLKMFLKLIGKEIWYTKSIYFTLFVHLFDSVTDYLLLIEWYFYSQKLDTDNDGINYGGCFYLSILILLLYRIVSGIYLYNYHNKNIWYGIGQIFDVVIVYELKESHLLYQRTENLHYLHKLEKSFESAPELLLQMYVMLRTINGIYTQNFSIVALLSIGFSFISLTTKIIADDKYVFIDETGANKFFPPTIPFIARCLFRSCEIIARLFIITLIAAYFGAWFFAFYMFLDILTNLMLFDRV